MKKAIILAAVISVLAAALTACHQAQISSAPPLDLSLQNIEFVEIYYNPSLHGSVAVDKQTGVMYWFSESGVATMLVNSYNSPRIWKEKP